MLYTYSFAGSLIYFPIFHIYVGVCVYIYIREFQCLRSLLLLNIWHQHQLNRLDPMFPKIHP